MVETALLGLKRLFFDRIFERSYWTWRRHPAIIIPTMLGTALTVIEQSIITLAAIAFLTHLALKGALPDFLSKVFRESGGAFRIFQDPAFALTLIPLALVSLAALFAVAVIGGGFVLSSEYGVYVEAWRNDRVSVRSILENGSRRWRPMAWTLFLSNLITWGPAAITYVFLLLASLNAATPGGLVAVVVSSSLFQIGLITSLILAVFTVYSFPAVVIDQISGFRAIRHSFRVASHNLGVTMTYSLVRVIFQVLLGLTVVLAGFIGLPLSSLAAAVLSLLLTPILHLTKTMIYSYAGPGVPEMPFELANPIWNDILRRMPRAAWLKMRTGLSEASKFLLGPRNLPFHIASIVAFGVGIALGNYVSSSGLSDLFLDLGYQPGRINPVFQQVIPPALGIDLFLHNWLVSIATALAGIGFGFPSFETILFNGFILGAIAPLAPDLTMLLAAILPHGIIEIPAFLLAGSVGIKLGFAAWKTRFQSGPESNSDLSESLREAVYIVVGLAPLFLIAGLIEGDVTPIIMRIFGWRL